MTCWDEVNVSAPTPRNTDIDQHETPAPLSDRWENVASWLRDPSRPDDPDGTEGTEATEAQAPAPDALDERWQRATSWLKDQAAPAAPAPDSGNGDQASQPAPKAPAANEPQA